MSLDRAGYTLRWQTRWYREAVETEARRILSDGCSGVLQAYLVVCQEHDVHYATHHDFFSGESITQERADLYLRWGCQWHSWLGRGSVLAFIRYRGLSRRHGLGLGTTSWDTGPQRLAERLRRAGGA